MSLIGRYIVLTLVSVANIDAIEGSNSNIKCEVKVGEGADDYFIPKDGPRSWGDARKACIECNSSLLIIRNKSEQEALSQFLKDKHRITSLVWTAGEQATQRRWTWINQDATPTPTNNQGEHETAAYLTEELTYRAQDPRNKVYYVCQFKSNDTVCSNEATNKIMLKNGCLDSTPLKDGRWYEARNDCLERGGDLPVLDQGDHLKLNQTNLWQYKSTTLDNLWLGLRKSSWTWYSNKTDDIKYTNWESLTHPDPSGVHCIAINATDGKWKPHDCSKKLEFICKTKGSITTKSSTTSISKTSPATTSSSMTSPAKTSISITSPAKTSISTTSPAKTSISITSPATTSISTTSPATTSSSMTSSTTNSTKTDQMHQNSNYATQAWKYAGSGIAIAVAIICIIIVIFAIRNRRKSSKRTTGNLESTAGPEQHLDRPHADSSNGVYAEIPMATTSRSEDAGNAHPGIVYASLDLGNSAKNSNLASANKTYPQGDIYAQVNKPKTQGDIYAQVNKPKTDGNPVQSKIGPLGDIYAQVNHDTKQPNQEQRDRSIYDNL